MPCLSVTCCTSTLVRSTKRVSGLLRSDHFWQLTTNKRVIEARINNHHTTKTSTTEDRRKSSYLLSSSKLGLTRRYCAKRQRFCWRKRSTSFETNCCSQVERDIRLVPSSWHPSQLLLAVKSNGHNIITNALDVLTTLSSKKEGRVMEDGRCGSISQL